MDYQVLKNKIKEIQRMSHILIDDTTKIIKNAEYIGEYLSKGRVTSSQIRNIFDAAKRIKWIVGSEEETINKLNLLRPKIAYLSGRHKKRALENLQKILDKAIIEVVTSREQKRFNKFQDFFEAIIAYHKYYER